MVKATTGKFFIKGSIIELDKRIEIETWASRTSVQRYFLLKVLTNFYLVYLILHSQKI